MKIPSLFAGRLSSCAWLFAVLTRFALAAAIAAVLSASAIAQTARFTAAEITVRTLSSDLYSVALDSSGNIYIASTTTNQVLKEVPYNGGYLESVVASGLNAPYAVALDKNGSVYIADQGNHRVLKETPHNRGYLQSTVVSGFDAPSGVAVDGNGNVYIADIGYNEVFKETWSGSHYTQSTVRTGLNSPYGVAVDSSGNVYIADSGNSRVLKEKPSGASYIQSLIGTGLSYPGGVTVDAGGNVYIADSGNKRILKEKVSGAGYSQSAVPTASTLEAPADVAVDAAGSVYIADIGFGSGYTGSIYKEFPSGANFGQVSVLSTSLPAKLAFTFQTGGTLGKVAVTTQGAVTGDFAYQNAGSCSQGVTYTAGETCAVEVTFAPNFAGTRNGAATLSNNAGNVIATGFAFGTGLGPQVNFLPGTQSTVPYVTSGQASPYGVAVDGSGDVFITDSDNNVVRKETWTGGGYVESLVGSGLNSPAGLAVDGSGALYIADTQNNRVLKETPSANGYIQTTIGSGLNQPYGVAVDGSGNVYINDTVNVRVLKETLTAGAYTQSTLPFSGLAYAFGVAVDGSGNVYIADTGNKDVLKLTLSAGAYTQSLVASSLDQPYGVAVDGFGNVFIPEFGNQSIIKLSPSNGVYAGGGLPINGLANPYAVAVDAGGNLYIADVGNDVVYKQDYADAPALNFAPTYVGQLSVDSPQTVTVENIGNEYMVFAIPATGNNPSISSNFELSDNASPACTVLSPASQFDATLQPGQQCDLSISFYPLAAGTLSGSVVLTDDAKNMTAPNWATQSIALNGTANLDGTFVGWNQPLPIFYGTALGATQLDAVATDGQVQVPGSFVYTPPAGTVLKPGVRQLSVAFTPTDTAQYAGSSANQTITVQKAQLTVTAKSVSRTYGAANPALTYTITGFVNGDTAANSITGAPAITTGATAASGAGNYSITAALGNLASANYTFHLVPGILTVNKAALTVTANNAGRIYGAANPAFTYAVTGFVNGDNAANAFSGAPTLATTAVATSPRGAYPITAALGTLLSANYTFSFAPGTLTVNQAPLVVTAKNASVVYKQPLPALAFTITGFVNGDSQSVVVSGLPTETTTATVGSLPGNYPITIAQGSLAAVNYTFQFTNGTLTVTPIGAAATPVMAPAGGTFTTAQTVTMTDSTPGESIYYTTNGTTPTINSTKYTVAFHVTTTETIKAIAAAPGYTQSAVASELFTIN